MALSFWINPTHSRRFMCELRTRLNLGALLARTRGGALPCSLLFVTGRKCRRVFIAPHPALVDVTLTRKGGRGREPRVGRSRVAESRTHLRRGKNVAPTIATVL